MKTREHVLCECGRQVPADLMSRHLQWCSAKGTTMPTNEDIRECPYCGRQLQRYGYAPHVAACTQNPNRSSTAGPRRTCDLCRVRITLRSWNRHVRSHVLHGDIKLTDAPWYYAKDGAAHKPVDDYIAETKQMLAEIKAGQRRTPRPPAESVRAQRKYARKRAQAKTTTVKRHTTTRTKTSAPGKAVIDLTLTEDDVAMAELLFPDGVPAKKLSAFLRWLKDTRELLS